MMDNETKIRVFAAYSPTDLARSLAQDVIEAVTDFGIDYDEKTEAVFLAFASIRAEGIAERAKLEAALLDGGRPLPLDRETLGRMVREAWVRWAQTQPSPKPSWLVPYDELREADKEADRQIGEAVARWTLIHDAARHALAQPAESGATAGVQNTTQISDTHSEPLDPSELEEALSTDNEDRHDSDWHLIELAAEKWLSWEQIFKPYTGANICDCERSHNGCGMGTRECDCPAGAKP